MNDKTKPAKPALDKSEAGVSKTLESCGLHTDASSAKISAGIIADNLAGGAKGSAVTAGARLAENVGKCVADTYDEKKPSLADRVGNYLGNLTSSFQNVAANFKEDAKIAIGEAALGATSAVTAGTPEKLKARPEQINAAVNSMVR